MYEQPGMDVTKLGGFVVENEDDEDEDGFGESDDFDHSQHTLAIVIKSISLYTQQARATIQQYE